MSEKGQIYFKNLAVNAARFLECVWQFRDIMHQKISVWYIIPNSCDFIVFSELNLN